MHAFSSVANRPLSLAGHLRHVASLLQKHAVTYNWTRPSECNCGLVACSIIGVTPTTLKMEMASHHGFRAAGERRNSWTARAQDFCPISGEPVDAIFKKLTAAGMQFPDFCELELLCNLEVLKRMEGAYSVISKKKRWLRKPIEVRAPLVVKHDERLSLQGYLETWATMIEEFHAKSVEAALDAIEDRPLVATI